MLFLTLQAPGRAVEALTAYLYGTRRDSRVLLFPRVVRKEGYSKQSHGNTDLCSFLFHTVTCSEPGTMGSRPRSLLYTLLMASFAI